MDYHSTIDERFSTTSNRDRDIPSFIEPRPPLILNPFMRPRPQKATNLLDKFYEDSIEEEAPELVQVYLRLKPSNVKSNLYEVRSDQCLVTSVDTATAGHGRRTQHNVSKMYTFSHIFGPDANQKEIFEHVVKENLRKLRDGHNFTLLTYGASGSGKTYTLMGTVKAPGLVPRALEYVFKVVDAAQSPLYHPGENGATKLSLGQQEHELQWVHHLRQVSAPLRDKYRRMSTRLVGDMTKSTLDLSARTKHYVWVSFVEIYNESIYDLLVTAERTAASKLKIREDSNGNAFVKGATQAFVRTGEEAYDVLVAGKHNLQVHATGVHAQSSRSHCIFTITMLTETENGVRASYVRLCDLAGSERARRTRNTGARMQESRAINTSLHVLERCLHTLRRKQSHAQDMVPYRESKLTRLLGAGLSGTRGEAVSMVVTLNPAPEFAHETRHVLTLAAVARDIQVNNTIAESISTLDSSCAETTLSADAGAELTRLRADNERLHYELVQAESLNAKLMADMADKQEKNALTLKELVDEARDIEKQYYTAQIKSLQERHNAELAELREEYEAGLGQKKREDGTPSRSLQKKIVQLMEEITILEEALSAERLARARMDEELQHLRTCIEERDEKSTDSKEDSIPLTDEDTDGEDEEEDIVNESLEPTFKKEDINRSRLIRRQSTLNNTHNTTFDKTIEDVTMEREGVSITIEQNDKTYVNESNQSIDCPNTVKKAAKEVNISSETFSVESNDDSKHSVRETYFVRDSKISLNEDEDDDSSKKSETDQSADNGIDVSFKDGNHSKDSKGINESANAGIEKPLKSIASQIDKIKQFAQSMATRDSSLTQFELLEQEANNYKKIDKKTKYFDDDDDKPGHIISPKESKEKKQYFDNIEPVKNDKVKELMIKQDLLRSPSIIQDDIPENYEPTTINKIIRESFTKNDIAPTQSKTKLLLKNQKSLDLFEESPCHKTVKESIQKIAFDDRKDDNIIQPVAEIVHRPIKLEKSPCQNGNPLDNTEKTRESIQKIALDDRKDDDIIQPVAEIVHRPIKLEKSPCQNENPRDNVEKTRQSIQRIALDDRKDDDIIQPVAQIVHKPNKLEKLPCQNENPLNNIEKTRESIEKIALDDRKDDVIMHPVAEIVHKPIKLEKSPCQNENPLDTVENARESIEKITLHDKRDEDITQPNVAEIETAEVVEKNPSHAKNMKEEEGTNSRNLKPAIEQEIDDHVEVPSPKMKNTKNKLQSESESVHDDQVELVNEVKIKIEVVAPETNETHNIQELSQENTFDAFEDIYRNVSVPRATDFELLVSDKSNVTNDNTTELLGTQNDKETEKEIKYNLRHKSKVQDADDVVLLENAAKCAPKTAKKSLRLRRQKAKVDFDDKLKDIVNLQKEFSDVTMDVPAPVKEVKDIPSPEQSEGENRPPAMGTQSCPSKSVTRSRRKLFTPRAEPLEESPPQTESGERIRVPRPSYHRPRTRRRLN